MIEHFSLRLVASRMLAPTVRHLSFERSDGAPLVCKPGQFLQVHCTHPDGTPAKRSFSIASEYPTGDAGVARVDLVVSYVEGGIASGLLANLAEGEQIEVSGPQGRFCFMDADSNQRYILMATGTGIAPYRAMRPTIAHLMRERGCRFVLLYGARNEEELLYGEEFEAFAREHEGFTFHPCLSRAARAIPRANDRAGHVQDVLPEIAPTPARDIAYLCGNPHMVDQAYQALKDAGLSVRYIRREKYVSSR